MIAINPRRVDVDMGIVCSNEFHSRKAVGFFWYSIIHISQSSHAPKLRCVLTGRLSSRVPAVGRTLHMCIM